MELTWRPESDELHNMAKIILARPVVSPEEVVVPAAVTTGLIYFTVIRSPHRKRRVRSIVKAVAVGEIGNVTGADPECIPLSQRPMVQNRADQRRYERVMTWPARGTNVLRTECVKKAYESRNLSTYG